MLAWALEAYSASEPPHESPLKSEYSTHELPLHAMLGGATEVSESITTAAIHIAQKCAPRGFDALYVIYANCALINCFILFAENVFKEINKFNHLVSKTIPSAYKNHECHFKHAGRL